MLFGHHLELFAVKHSTYVITVNNEAKTFFTNFGAQPEKIKVIPIAVDHSVFASANASRESTRKLMGLKPDDVLLIFVGRLDVEKNVEGLIKAYISLLDNGKLSNSHLLIVGSGSLREQAEKEIPTHLKSKFTFAGVRTDIPELLAASDIFVLPSFIEGCPTALIEAMVAGKALVASDIPSIAELVNDGHSGLLFKAGDIDGLAVRLEQLYSSYSLRVNVGNSSESISAVLMLKRFTHKS